MPAVDSTGALRDVSLEVWAAHSELPYFEKVLTFRFLETKSFVKVFQHVFWGPSFGSSLKCSGSQSPQIPWEKKMDKHETVYG